MAELRTWSLDEEIERFKKDAEEAIRAEFYRPGNRCHDCHAPKPSHVRAVEQIDGLTPEPALPAMRVTTESAEQAIGWMVVYRKAVHPTPPRGKDEGWIFFCPACSTKRGLNTIC